MKRIISGCIISILVFSAFCMDTTILREKTVNNLIVENELSKEQTIVIDFDDKGFLCSLDSENLKIHVDTNKNIYDLYFQNSMESWHQQMVHEKNCWKWFNNKGLICNIYYSEEKKTVTSDSKNYTINIKYENKRININLGSGRKCIFDMSKPIPVFITDRDITSISEINNEYIFTDYFDNIVTEFSIKNTPAFMGFSNIAFLIPVLFHIDYYFYPFITGIINISGTQKYYATSYLIEGKTTYEPEHLKQKDGLPWASGNGKGIGDVISIKEFKHKNPSELVIMNGYQDKNHPDYYDKNSRVKSVKITNSKTKKSKTIIVKDSKEEQRFSLIELGTGNEYEFEIMDVYTGIKYDDLCIQYLAVE